jgi:hypothetical protein
MLFSSLICADLLWKAVGEVLCEKARVVTLRNVRVAPNGEERCSIIAAIDNQSKNLLYPPDEVHFSRWLAVKLCKIDSCRACINNA